MILIESVSGTGNESWTYTGTQTPGCISFANDGAVDDTIVISGHSIIVKPGESFDVSFSKPFNEVAITATGGWRMLIGK
jgi:hypothetical protein